MLPKFNVKQYGDGRWYVVTDWFCKRDANGFASTVLQVTTGGKLDAASAGWATEAKALAAMEQCKRRLR